MLESIKHLPVLSPTAFRVTLTVAPSRAAMDSLVGGRTPEWVGAVALPARNEIVIPGRRIGPESLFAETRMLRHEWAHLALARELDGLRVPRWFNEGYAEWSAGGWLDGGGRKLGAALAFGGAPPLDSLELSWPRDRVPAEVAYLLSASVVEYLVQASPSGVRALEAFLAEARRSRSFDRALREVYGVTEDQLESDWRRWVKRRYGWLALLSDSLVFWAALAMALGLMVWVRRRYRRVQIARLRAEEPPDAPAYWSGGSVFRR